LLGGGKKKQQPLLPRPATRDDAALLAERDAELARRGYELGKDALDWQVELAQQDSSWKA
jgi:hypothetical protein